MAINVQTYEAAEIIKNCNKAGEVCRNCLFLSIFAKGLGGKESL